MKQKQVSFSWSGNRADINGLPILRMLPNRYVQAVGSFVFLDHFGPANHPPVENKGTGVHPHRGIATLSYLFKGEANHEDSAGNNQTIQSGGLQWMKAGKGILHNETIHGEVEDPNHEVHGVQFWINLPPAIKEESPEYKALDHTEIPKIQLPDQSGTIKVLVGKYAETQSPVPTYNEEFLYHLRLSKLSTFVLDTKTGDEYAVFLPSAGLVINETHFEKGEFIEFDRNGGLLTMHNPLTSDVDVLIFGGAPYTDPIVAEGPFVMNSKLDIAMAYRDFLGGKYGTLGNIGKQTNK
jgi:redox-sensitive bicupin YhaK (pirin superfamily)